ncbi:hypothetical protein BH10BAC2_BH10BAC2_49030 [soil metagenome]
MIKTIIITISFWLAAALQQSNAQQPVLSVQSFEYIWQKVSTAINEKGQFIIVTEDSIKRRIEKSFERAIQQRWTIDMPKLALSVKPWSLFSLSYAPKFNTKLKEKKPGTWYLFLQIFDTGNSFFYNPNDSIATLLKVKCKVICYDDSVILNRNLLVTMDNEKTPSDQVVLKTLPAHPSSFAKAFDSIATWLFQQDDITEKNIPLKPACVFNETKFDKEPIALLKFNNDDYHISNLKAPPFLFRLGDPTFIETKKIDNATGNIASGTLALFSGLPLSKKKTFEYNAYFPFEMQDSTAYHCIIHFAEVQAADFEREKEKDIDGNVSFSLHSSGYYTSWRAIDPGFENFVTLGSDTLITFKLEYLKSAEYKTYTRFWDGTDSATINDLPDKWKNRKGTKNVMLRGQIEGIPFIMQSRKDFTEKQFYFEDKLVMVTFGADTPQRVLLFQPLSEQQIKLFTILSSISYAYFNTI